MESDLPPPPEGGEEGLAHIKILERVYLHAFWAIECWVWPYPRHFIKGEVMKNVEKLISISKIFQFSWIMNTPTPRWGGGGVGTH